MDKRIMNLQLFADCQCEAEDECGTCESCQSYCQKNCTSTCQQNCTAVCEDSCMENCELYCTSNCQQNCTSNCEENCTSNCEENCTSNCQVNCTTGCQVNCTTGCQVNCTTGCEVNCTTGCQVNCTTGCQVVCTTCQSNCTANCTSTCESVCQCQQQNNQTSNSGFSVLATSHNSILVTISDLQYNANQYDEFNILVNNQDNKFTSSSSSNSTSRNISGLQPSTSYTVKVKAKWNGVWYTVDTNNPTKTVITHDCQNCLGVICQTCECETENTMNPGSGGEVEEQSSYNMNPNRKSDPTSPRYINREAHRGVDALNTIIDQFDVENRVRYKKDSNGTYCNIFAWDVTVAMCAEIPHWIRRDDEMPYQYDLSLSYNENAAIASEYNVNRTVTWLVTHAGDIGYVECTAQEAQEAANSGEVAVALWENPDPNESGHIQVVRPTPNGEAYNHDKGIYLAQAGGTCYNKIYLRDEYSSSYQSALKYYKHN